MTSTSRSGPIAAAFLHSFSGFLACSERPLLYAGMLAVEEINAKGGVLGREIRPEIYDGASRPEKFAECAKRILRTECRTIFGCWTSSARKAVRPVVEGAGGILWYPVQNEGLEESPNIVYTGSCPNQQMIPALDWLSENAGNRFFLIGSDSVYPRTMHILIRSEIERRGAEVAGEELLPSGVGTCPDAVYREMLECAPDAVISTLNVPNTIDFITRCRSHGIDPRVIPVMHLDVSETEMRAAGDAAAGHMACWSYFESLRTSANRAFLSRFRARFGSVPCTARMISAYVQVHLWARACERAESLDPGEISSVLDGVTFDGPGGPVRIEANRHVSMMSHIGRYGSDGEFVVLRSSDGPIPPTPWQGVEYSRSRFRQIVRGALGYLSEEIFRSATLGETLLERTTELEAANRELRREIGERVRAQEEFRKSEERFRTLFSKAPVAMAFLGENGTLLDVNERFVELTGYTLSEIRDFSEWIELGLPDDDTRRTVAELWNGFAPTLRTDISIGDRRISPKRFSIRRASDGTLRFVECTASILDRGILICMNDVTEQNTAIESLHQLKESLEIRVVERTSELEIVNRRLRMASMEDALTKLANRRWFNATFEREIRRARRTGDSLTLMMIDVDFFKQYNDRYGHIKGDLCLKKIGAALRETFRRAEDLPCRYGGEEFAVILPGIAADSALSLAERVRRKIENLLIPHDASSVAPMVTISAGVASEVRPSISMEQFIDRADRALYKAKEQGRNRVVLWE